MSLTAAVVRILAEKGLTAADIVEVAEALEATVPAYELSPLELRRAADRQRQADKRARDKSRDSHVTPPREAKVSPTPPSKTQSHHTPSPPKGGSVPTPKAFDQFWLAYPRKVGKDGAKRKFVIAWRRILDADPAAEPLSLMLGGLERAKAAWLETDSQFIPHPATWLHNGRWQDEPETHVASRPPVQALGHRQQPRSMAGVIAQRRGFAAE